MGYMRVHQGRLFIIVISMMVIAFFILAPADVSAAKKKDISKCTVHLSYTKATYTGKTLKPKVTVKRNGKKVSSKYYRVKYSHAKNPGTATVKVIGKGKYKGTVKKYFKIKVGAPKNPTFFFTGDKTVTGDSKIDVFWTAPKKCSYYKVAVTKDGKSFGKGTYKTKKTKLRITDLNGPGIFKFTITAYGGPKRTASKAKKLYVTAVVAQKKVGEAAYMKTKGPAIGKKAFGDQTGKEVRIGKWYYSGDPDKFSHWTYVMRFKDPVLAETAAQIMEATCKNDYVGYDNRTSKAMWSFYNAAVAKNWDVSKIDRACFTACSQLVAACVDGACTLHGVTPAYEIDPGPNATAKYMYKNLKKTKLFDIYSDKNYLQTDINLQRGDILVTVHSNGKNNHTVMVLY